MRTRFRPRPEFRDERGHRRAEVAETTTALRVLDLAGAAAGLDVRAHSFRCRGSAGLLNLAAQIRLADLEAVADGPVDAGLLLKDGDRDGINGEGFALGKVDDRARGAGTEAMTPGRQGRESLGPKEGFYRYRIDSPSWLVALRAKLRALRGLSFGETAIGQRLLRLRNFGRRLHRSLEPRL